MTEGSPPRIYCIPALRAPVVAVFRRGPSAWSHVGRWDLAAHRYEPGAWLGGRLFPRRSDLSPDGRWLCYFAHKPSARWAHGEAYVAVSKLPWLTALHAFATCGTWTRGYWFTDAHEDDAAEQPSWPIPYQLKAIRPEQFATERRRGWEEAPDSPPRSPTDAWDERRNARMRKRQPGGDRVLLVESIGWAGGEFGPAAQAVGGLRVSYALESNGDIELLPDLQWADWDHEGHLLVATRDGRIASRRLEGRRSDMLFEADLSQLGPQPTAAPDWAQRW